MVDNYPGNSRQQRDDAGRAAPKAKPVVAERPKIEQIVSKPVVPKKKSLTQRFVDNLTNINFREVVTGVVMEVLVPATKDMIVDGGIQAIERAVYGESKGGRSKIGHLAAKSGHTAYNRMSSTSIRRDPRQDPRRPVSRVAHASGALDDLLPFENRQEAEDVLAELADLINKYGSTTVMDMKEMCGIPAYHTDAKWGWTDLRGSQIMRRRGEYFLELPDPEELPS